MPSGERSQTWFPEMIHELRQRWRGDLSMAELIGLAQSLDNLLLHIRATRGIRPPIILCPKCGKPGPAAPRRVSVRAAILAAGRFGIGAKADVEQLERLWKRHRSEEALDLYGSPAGSMSGVSGQEADGCPNYDRTDSPGGP